VPNHRSTRRDNGRKPAGAPCRADRRGSGGLSQPGSQVDDAVHRTDGCAESTSRKGNNSEDRHRAGLCRAWWSGRCRCGFRWETGGCRIIHAINLAVPIGYAGWRRLSPPRGAGPKHGAAQYAKDPRCRTGVAKRTVADRRARLKASATATGEGAFILRRHKLAAADFAS
jgi:hypothetical protein